MCQLATIVYENTHAMHNTGVGKAKAWNDDFKQTFIDSVSQKRTEVDILCEMIDTKDLNEIDTEFIDTAVKETYVIFYLLVLRIHLV